MNEQRDNQDLAVIEKYTQVPLQATRQIGDNRLGRTTGGSTCSPVMHIQRRTGSTT